MAIIDFSKVMRRLLPKGDAWEIESDSTIQKIFDVVSDEFNLIQERAAQLFEREINPGAAQAHLEDWEQALALPDECTKTATTLEERQQAAHAKFTNIGGLNPANYEGIASSLGYEATVKPLRPFRCGKSKCGQNVNDPEKLYYFEVVSTSGTVKYARSGSFRSGNPIMKQSNEILECMIHKLKPSHELVKFRYINSQEAV